MDDRLWFICSELMLTNSIFKCKGKQCSAHFRGSIETVSGLEQENTTPLMKKKT